MVCQQGQGLEPCGRRVSLRRNRRNDAERNDAQRLAAGAAAVGMGVERCKPCKFCAHPFLPKEGLGTYTLYASLCPCAYIYIYIHTHKYIVQKYDPTRYKYIYTDAETSTHVFPRRWSGRTDHLIPAR